MTVSYREMLKNKKLDEFFEDDDEKKENHSIDE